MDLEEWEFLSDDGFMDLHEDVTAVPVIGKKVISRENVSLHPNSIIDMNYFQKFIEPPKKNNSRGLNPVVHVPIQLDSAIPKNAIDHELPMEVTRVPIQINLLPSSSADTKTPEKTGALEAAAAASVEQETISQVFFKKMKENEFVDMKMDSPKSTNWGFNPQIDVGMHHFEGKDGNFNGDSVEKEIVGKEKNPKGGNLKEEKELGSWEEDNGGLNLLKKWGMTGIGAICSFGFAAATICIIVFGSAQKEKQHQHNQKLHFQIYRDDKRMKQVVHHATKWNEAISAVRGAPLATAHITFGGYVEGL
ncbi:hypothetical protein Ancab_030873 [Ancistrocladus abbreviatus]